MGKKKMIDGKPDTRISWDDYFMRIARDVSLRSNCSRRHVGAVIVKDNRIVSTGYNGTPIGTTNCFEGGCPRCSGEHRTGEKLDECLCVHAEQNAICAAAKFGNAIDGGAIYVTCSPCLTCLKLIINSGIRKVVFGEWYREFNAQEKRLIEEAGISVELKATASDADPVELEKRAEPKPQKDNWWLEEPIRSRLEEVKKDAFRANDFERLAYKIEELVLKEKSIRYDSILEKIKALEKVGLLKQAAKMLREVSEERRRDA